MGAVVSFDYDDWVARFPELDAVTQPRAEAFFAEATIFWANDGSGPVTDDIVQLALLNLLTAHLAGLNAVISGSLPYNVVGRVTSASEGSVSVGVTLTLPPGTAEWYGLTRWGFEFWTMTAAYRTMRYRPGPRRVFDRGPYGPYWGRTF